MPGQGDLSNLLPLEQVGALFIMLSGFITPNRGVQVVTLGNGQCQVCLPVLCCVDFCSCSLAQCVSQGA